MSPTESTATQVAQNPVPADDPKAVCIRSLHIMTDGDLVAVHGTVSGRHTGPFAHYDGAVSQVMPPTGRTFAATHTHWFRHADGMIIEHWANRDDLATAQQAGWVPPSPR